MNQETMQKEGKEVEETKQTEINKMRQIKIERVVLSIGGSGEDLEKGARLLEKLTGKKVSRRKSRKRIPSLGVRPGLEVGCLVTLRGEKAEEILSKLLAAIDNQVKEKQISENSLSFGVKEYIEIPGIEYQRDIGIIGFDVNVVFSRAGKRVEERKRKRSRLPKKQDVSREEIVEFMKNKFDMEVIEK